MSRLEEFVVLTLGGGRKAARCQAHNRRGEQCRRPSRKGYTKCGHHGPGYAKREQAGIRRSPRTASITTALSAQPRTIEEWVGLQRGYETRVEFYRTNTQKLRDLNEVLARLWAVADIIGERRPSISSTVSGEKVPPLFTVTMGVIHGIERVSRIEWKIRMSSAPTLTSWQAQQLVGGLVDVLHEYVPADQIDNAILQLERVAHRVLGTVDPSHRSATEPSAEGRKRAVSKEHGPKVHASTEVVGSFDAPDTP